jgi:hypothetical protein
MLHRKMVKNAGGWWISNKRPASLLPIASNSPSGDPAQNDQYPTPAPERL